MKKRKKKKNFYTFGNFILIIILIVLCIIIFKPSDSSSNKDNNNNNNKNEEKVLTEEEKKLQKLNNIDKKIDFFKMDNLDRYIAYKEMHNELDDETIIVYVNIGLDQKFYTNVKDAPNKDTNKVITNKYYFLGSDYIPSDMVVINSKYSIGERKMQKDAANAFEEMVKDALKEGYTVKAASTYRSYSYQDGLYNRYKASDGEEKADTYSARPGYSEHQTGLAVDVSNGKSSYTDFGNTKEFNWMKENAYKYGYILRYTKETEFITGYMNEPWHYRYVGKDIANYIHNHPMTYEEYFVRFLDK